MDKARARYYAMRRQARDGMPAREDRGLPHHPDGSGSAPCPDCDGAGGHVVNDTNPYGFGPDPQCDEEVDCSRCNGNGEVDDGEIDPILSLRWHRQQRLTRRPFASYCYGALLQRVASPATLPADSGPTPHTWRHAA